MTNSDLSNISLPPGVPPPFFPKEPTTEKPVVAATQSTTPAKSKFPSIYDRKIGSLWVETDKNGEKYLSGLLKMKGSEKNIRILLFRSKNKTKETYPDWEIFLEASEFTNASKDLKL